MPQGTQGGSFYTYMWLREDGTPYYVGKGKDDRAFKKHRIGTAPTRDRIILEVCDSEEEAHQVEIFLISYFGREDKSGGSLLNLTDGGDSAPTAKGFKHTQESIERWRQSRAGWKHSMEARIRMSESRRGRPSWSKGKAKPLEQRRKISETLKTKGIGFVPAYTPWNKGKPAPQCGWSKGMPWTQARREAQERRGNAGHPA